MMKHQLNLEYTLSPGWMQPWVDGLMGGTVFARACDACGNKTFAPQRICACGCQEGNWVLLDGNATIIRQTHGTDGHFAMVQFDGADNEVVVRLEGFEPSHTKGRLKAPAGKTPQMILEPIESMTV